MPYTAKTFAKKNKKLKGKALETAAKQATAMERAGVDPGISIATANKTGNRLMKKRSWLG
jgi:saccharopine dehydrogenase-like NADP-dependent oxidoreductase